MKTFKSNPSLNTAREGAQKFILQNRCVKKRTTFYTLHRSGLQKLEKSVPEMIIVYPLPVLTHCILDKSDIYLALKC